MPPLVAKNIRRSATGPSHTSGPVVDVLTTADHRRVGSAAVPGLHPDGGGAVPITIAGARWIKSSRSNVQNECVELARAATAIGVRDSKNVNPILEFAPANPAVFITRTKAGDVNHLT
jgi:hypothetical protein